MDKPTKEQLHGKKMGWICVILAVAAILLIIAGIILGYFISYVGHDGDMRDGWGRLLDDVPGGFSIILRQWAGFIWFFVDCIVIFSLIIVTDKLFVKSRVYFTGTKHVDF
jgi:hypothetical protein